MIQITKHDGTKTFGAHNCFGITLERANELCELFNKNDSQKDGDEIDGSMLIEDFCKGAENEQEQAFCIFQSGIRWEFITQEQYMMQIGIGQK